ncbi:MAG: hypothetical protein M5U01_26715 [Ardenticatenaceae bacterium]|nr:hypothetical protein [Ardenticatenaceae bacterium]HBY93742.1 hypothetical protein [Chloroflexota bacterium]
MQLGWDERCLLTLFVNPMFLATHRIYRQKSQDYVQELIRRTVVKKLLNRYQLFNLAKLRIARNQNRLLFLSRREG